MKRVGYRWPRSCILYHYVFTVCDSKHGILLGSLFSQESHQITLGSIRRRATTRKLEGIRAIGRDDKHSTRGRCKSTKIRGRVQVQEEEQRIRRECRQRPAQNFTLGFRVLLLDRHSTSIRSNSLLGQRLFLHLPIMS